MISSTDKKDRLNIVLINPSYVLPFFSSAPPLWLLYLAAVAEQKNCKVHIIDMVAKYSTYTISNVVEQCERLRPDIIGVSLGLGQICSAYALVDMLRPLKSLLVSGGPHTTQLPEEVIDHGFDISVLGEGEEIFSDIIDFVKGQKKLEDINGIVYKKKDSFISTGRREPISDLDKPPFPARHLISLSDYVRTDSDLDSFCTLITSRGCPFSCTYCVSSAVFGKKYIYRSPENIIKEIIELHEKYDVKNIAFVDDLFTMDKERIKRLCRLLISSGISIHWSCITKIDCLDKELLNIMHKAGCRVISYGIESFNEITLKRTNKNIDLPKAYKILTYVHDLGIKNYVNLMTGVPWENEKDYKENLASIKKFSRIVHYYSCISLVPLPGSHIYEKYKNKYSFKNWWLRPEFLSLNTDMPLYRRVYYDDYLLNLDFFKYKPNIRKQIRRQLKFIRLFNLRISSNYLLYLMLIFICLLSKLVYMVDPRLEKMFFSNLSLEDKVFSDLEEHIR